MKFDAHIEALRKGADGNLTMAKEARSNAAKHQKMANDFTAEAVQHEELAQGFDLLADALATGRLTTDQLRGIVNGMLSDDPDAQDEAAEEADTDTAMEAFVDVADAERYAQRDEYVDYAEAADVREIEREMAIEAGDDSEALRQEAEDDARAERNAAARHWASGHDMATCTECADQYAAEQRADAEFQAAVDAENGAV